MAGPRSEKKVEAAWNQIEALGGHGVWEPDMVIMSLASTAIADSDLSLFRDFPYVQVLDLSHTGITDTGLAFLTTLPALEELIVVGTHITPAALDAFQRRRPSMKITTKPHRQGGVNPFIGGPN